MRGVERSPWEWTPTDRTVTQMAMEAEHAYGGVVWAAADKSMRKMHASIQNRPNTFTHLSIPASFRFTRLPRCSYVRLRRMKCKCTSANIACFPGFHLSWQVFSVSDRKIPVMTGFLRNLPAIFTLLWSLPTGTYSRDEIIIDSSESVWFGLIGISLIS